VNVFGMLRSGAAARVTDTVERLTGEPARPFADFAREHAAAFAAAGVAVAS
jgi:hypothetical protein